MKYLAITGAIIILVILGSSCRQAAAPAGDNQTSLLQGISINTTQAEMLGKLAPEFHLNDINGNLVSLSDFHGKPVLLTFWATWSLDCQKEMPVIQQVYNNWQSRGLVVLTIDILNSRPDETQANIEAFMSKNNYI